MLSECRNENIVLGVGDIAALLRKLDELKENQIVSCTELEKLRE